MNGARTSETRPIRTARSQPARSAIRNKTEAGFARMLAAGHSWTSQDVTGCSRTTIAKIAKR
jgi:hypothetical protein